MLINTQLDIKIGGLQKSSMLDYPGEISAIVFTQGCNFMCPYCHNAELIGEKGVHTSFDAQGILDFLQSRIGQLDAVVITGGEPTIQPDLVDFIKKIKRLRFLVKLDTNGSNPDMLEKLLESDLLDYVAMDIKAPIEKYSEVVCANVKTDDILKSIDLLRKYKVEHEFRTTVVKSQLSFDDFEKIGQMIHGADKYYLQKFVSSKILNKFFMYQTTYSDAEFAQIAENLKKYIKNVEVR